MLKACKKVSCTQYFQFPDKSKHHRRIVSNFKTLKQPPTLIASFYTLEAKGGTKDSRKTCTRTYKHKSMGTACSHMKTVGYTFNPSTGNHTTLNGITISNLQNAN